jgi:hypothetical protein
MASTTNLSAYKFNRKKQPILCQPVNTSQLTVALDTMLRVKDPQKSRKFIPFPLVS